MIDIYVTNITLNENTHKEHIHFIALLWSSNTDKWSMVLGFKMTKYLWEVTWSTSKREEVAFQVPVVFVSSLWMVIKRPSFSCQLRLTESILLGWCEPLFLRKLAYLETVLSSHGFSGQILVVNSSGFRFGDTEHQHEWFHLGAVCPHLVQKLNANQPLLIST